MPFCRNLFFAMTLLGFLPGCGGGDKPIDQGKLETEFKDLQDARKKEDPFAGKRK